MLPIRTVFLALCASVAIAAPLGGVCPTTGDCPKCGVSTEELKQLVCGAKSSFVVATGVAQDGQSWMSPRRWQDILGADGNRYAVQTYPIDERHWEPKNGECRNYFVKPVYDITRGQKAQAINAPSVTGLYINMECRCPELIRGAGYAVIVFKDHKIHHLDELLQASLDNQVTVAPLSQGEWIIPSCDEDFDASGIDQEKLPSAFINDETEKECSERTITCPKCDIISSTDQLEGICQSQQAVLVKRIMDDVTPAEQAAPWNMPKISIYVAKDNAKADSQQLHIKIVAREKNSCIGGKFRILNAFTPDFDDNRNQSFQLGQDCECDYLRHHTGFALLQSERKLSEEGILSENEKILIIPEGQYVIPYCQQEQAEERSVSEDDDDEQKAECDELEESCPVCDEITPKIQEAVQSIGTYVVKMQTNRHLKPSKKSEDAKCGAVHLISIFKGDNEKVEPELPFTLPEKCRCDAMSAYGRQFYAVIKKDAFGGERLEKLPLNENVYIISYNYRSYSLIQRWIDSREENYVNDRIDNDGYNSMALQEFGGIGPSYGPPPSSKPYAAPQQRMGGYGQFQRGYGGQVSHGGQSQGGYGSQLQSRGEAPVSYQPLYSSQQGSQGGYMQSALPQYSNYGMYVPIEYEPTYAPPTSPRPPSGSENQSSSGSYRGQSMQQGGYRGQIFGGESYPASPPSPSYHTPPSAPPAPSYQPPSLAPFYQPSSPTPSYQPSSAASLYQAPAPASPAPSHQPPASAPPMTSYQPLFPTSSYQVPAPAFPTPSYQPPPSASPAPSYQPLSPVPSYQPSSSAPSYQPHSPVPSYQPSSSAPSYPPPPPAPSYQPSPPAPSYQPPPSAPSYQPPHSEPAFQPLLSEPSYQPPPLEASYQLAPTEASYQPLTHVPSYQPAPAESSYQPPHSEPSYQPPSSEPSYQSPSPVPSYQPPSPVPSYQPHPPAPSYQASPSTLSYQPPAPVPPTPSYQPSSPASSYQPPVPVPPTPFFPPPTLASSAPSYQSPTPAPASSYQPYPSAFFYQPPAPESSYQPSLPASSFQSHSLASPYQSRFSAPSYQPPSSGPSYQPLPSASPVSSYQPSILTPPAPYQLPSLTPSALSYQPSPPAPPPPSYQAFSPTPLVPAYQAPPPAPPAPSYPTPPLASAESSYQTPAPAPEEKEYGGSALAPMESSSYGPQQQGGYSSAPSGGSYGQPPADNAVTSIAVSYSMPITIPIVSAKASASKIGGHGSSDSEYGSGVNDAGYGKTSGTHVVETKVEAIYTTIVGIQPAEQAPSAAPSLGGSGGQGQD
ncbi:uncharacterized protein LOC111268762 isoform X3 [Varroa jacobsoni]|uniref:uncharacterized protein LOC111268762 isoform X3 n=1 Tax=Varroa jacobsoni TaxID=62625 RepID=UPI000BF4F336|nr:uncharacterized protein LOC111268762 isoform X3 [Varroa jacobsoni]